MDDKSTPVTESILNSVKKLIPIEPDDTDFDVDILLNINAAIFTLSQLGVGPDNGYTVTDDSQTYSDFLSDDPKGIVNQVKMYLVCKTKLVFDSTSLSASVIEMLEKQIKEIEWRLTLESDTKGGENSK